MSMSAIGIDLGTMNTVVSFFIDGQPMVLELEWIIECPHGFIETRRSATPRLMNEKVWITA